MDSPQKRIELFNQATALREKGIGYRQVARILGISRNTVASWFYYGKSPYTNLNIANLSPSPALSYVIGVALGDGCVYKTKARGEAAKGCYEYHVNLAVNDREFVDEFNTRICKVVGREKPYPVFRGSTTKYILHTYSRHLYEFLCDKDIEKFKPIIESYPAEFIRALFDSDGSVLKPNQLALTNSDIFLLRFVRDLLAEYFGIKATIISQKAKRGNIKGREVKPTKDFYYQLRINSKGDVEKYMKFVGFTIRRKREKVGFEYSP